MFLNLLGEDYILVFGVLHKVSHPYHIPNANLFGVLNNLNFEVPDNLSMVPNTSPLGNRRSSSDCHHNNVLSDFVSFTKWLSCMKTL
ncbi:hypothetical protein LXL04_003601 [Taraxacum kok-saghyz]